MNNKKIIFDHTDDQYGDFVVCCNCDHFMLLPIGAEICPYCKTSGVLAWIDDVIQEASIAEINKIGYEIHTGHSLSIKEYLTPQTIKNEFSQ